MAQKSIVFYFGTHAIYINYASPHLAFGCGLIQRNTALVECVEYIGRSIIDSVSSRMPGS